MVEIFHRRANLNINKTIYVKNNGEKRQQNLASLRSMIAPHQKKEIVKKLFKSDEQAFDNFIQELEKIDNWHEAWQAVESELSNRHIYLHQPEAVFFTDILYSRYFPGQILR